MRGQSVSVNTGGGFQWRWWRGVALLGPCIAEYRLSTRRSAHAARGTHGGKGKTNDGRGSAGLRTRAN